MIQKSTDHYKTISHTEHYQTKSLISTRSQMLSSRNVAWWGDQEWKQTSQSKTRIFIQTLTHLAKTSITTSPKNFFNVYSRTGFEWLPTWYTQNSLSLTGVNQSKFHCKDTKSIYNKMDWAAIGLFKYRVNECNIWMRKKDEEVGLNWKSTAATNITWSWNATYWQCSRLDNMINHLKGGGGGGIMTFDFI